MDVLQLREKIAEAGNRYVASLNIDPTNDWMILKTMEEAGELVQAFLRYSARARPRDLTAEELKRALAGGALFSLHPRGADDGRHHRPMQTAVFAHQNVLKRGHGRKETNGLKRPGNPALGDAVGAKPADAAPVDQEFARGRLDETGDDVE